jgi:hypothetical protein
MRALVAVLSEWLQLLAAPRDTERRARDERPLCSQPLDERERTLRAKKRHKDTQIHTVQRCQ